MNYQTLSFLFLLMLNITSVFSQTESSFFKHINYLCSEEVHGRGAEFRGDSIAAEYIASEYAKSNLEKINKRYFQSFEYDVNTFPGSYTLSVNGKVLRPGDDFMVHPGSRSGKGKFSTVRLTSENWKNAKFRRKFLAKPIDNKVLIYDSELNDTKIPDYFKLKLLKLKASGLVEVLNSDPIAGEISAQIVTPTFQINKSKLSELGDIKTIEFELDAVFVEDYPSQNVVGFVKGSDEPNHVIVVSAHYDHIGHLGKDIMIQGANDNASGVAMLLSLAEYFGKKEHQPTKSMLFIAFAAEEIGLLGSKKYVENPLFPLEQTDFVLNLDLMGSGSEGITVVNGEELELQYQLLTAINESSNYVPEIKRRANRANSDHFPFTQNGVPAFFVYARGKVGGYHNLGDTIETLETGQFEGLFDLFVEFLRAL